MAEKKKQNLFLSRFQTELLLVGILVALFLFFGMKSPVFLKVDTLMKLLKQASIYGIIAIGMTFVITSSGIDLSVGSVVGLSGIIVSMCMVNGVPVLVSILIAIGASVLVGLFNGVLVHNAKVPPFIATMASMTVVRNVILLMTGAKTISNLPQGFTAFASGSVLGIPNMFLTWLAIITLGIFITGRTVFGRNIYAYGSNKESARLSGINISSTVYGVYIFSAIVCGIAGILMAARLGNGVPTSGVGYELDAIAASVVGGASLDGGEGSVIGTVLGAMIMATLRQGGTLLGINSFIMEIMIGSLIAIAVVIDKMRKS
ncbi:ABC transporter permease [Lacrimispora saccharolytica]|uniref:Inner-membrane translocator n=1 Tax=Lacrimispora saccharolytica (strain ATCC 35040 / DSM 2544 / NRCC 2533 / WM1) TaxID=610130 RepID=D9R857_LACSW|nr:ABC transporter permease [Lacrimispora saccharolytica]ADL03809.1 inner-membrane translocator [[Clostridium] saccharolyticum WM1]QRV21874.1 ABC transporter permease [Lacrimispora saccharolytica]